MKSRIFVLLLVILLIIPVPSAAQIAPENLLGIVKAFLNQQLGREASLLEWNFEGATWTDSSFGCPQEGQTYSPINVSGYRWTLLMDDGIRYSLHSDLAGENIILCAADSERVLTYSTYSGAYFTIQHPNVWSAQPLNQTEISFNFRGQTACNLPTMRVLVTANYPSASVLLETYLASVGIDSTTVNFFPINETAVSVNHAVDCNGIQQIRRASAFLGSTNTAYLVLQTAPVNVFGIWEPAFMDMLNTFQPAETPLSGSGATINNAGGGVNTAASSFAATATPLPQAAQPTFTPTPEPNTVTSITGPTPLPSPTATPSVPAPPEVAAVDLTIFPIGHVFVGDVYIGRSNNLPGVGVTADEQPRRNHLRTSRDGLQLAFVEDGRSLYTVSTTAPADPNLLSDALAEDFPPAWGWETSALAYLTESEQAPEAETGVNLDINVILPDGTTRIAGTIPFEGNCAVESEYRVDQLYWQETGYNGNNLTFEWLPNNQILYSSHCDGSGLQIRDEAGDITELPTDLHRAKVSPDGMHLAGIGDSGLVVVDLDTLQTTTIQTSLVPDQVGWDITGTQIFYVNLFAAEAIVWRDDSTEERAREILGTYPFESRLNTITLFQMDIRSLIEVQLWQGTGFAVGTLEPIPDGRGILFTLIPSDRGLLTNFANSADPAVVRNSIPETELYFLPMVRVESPDPSPPQLLAFTSQPVFGRVTPPPPSTTEG